MNNATSEAIQVVIRIRPMQKYEESRGDKVCVKPISDGKEIQIKTDRNEAQRYKCNQCFARDTAQVEFFEKSRITDLIDSVVEGYRACVFAFGQTGAGKTYTVVGPSKSITPGLVDDGLLGRSLDYMFTQLDNSKMKYSVRISCLEIYHENVYDLMSDDKRPTSLAIREHAIEGFFLEGSKLISCTHFKQACSIIDIAMRRRHIGENDVNVRSSRSHCITEIYVDVSSSPREDTQSDKNTDEIQNENLDNDSDHSHRKSESDNALHTSRFGKVSGDYVKSGKLSLIDLAGSERLKSTRTTRTRLQEAGFINKSLYVLGKVIAGLARTHGDLNHRDVPYRDSKLTKLLINSLGGRGRTMLIACVTEASGCQMETLRTLKFSMSCARIKNRPVRFLDPHERLITELRDEIKRLRVENRILRKTLATAPSDMQFNGPRDKISISTARDESPPRRAMSAGFDDNEDDDLIEVSSITSNRKSKQQKTSYRRHEPTSYRSNYGGFKKNSYNNNGSYLSPLRKPTNRFGNNNKKKPAPKIKQSQSDDQLFQQDSRLQRLQDRLAKLEAEEYDFDTRSSVSYRTSSTVSLAAQSSLNKQPWQENNNAGPNKRKSSFQNGINISADSVIAKNTSADTDDSNTKDKSSENDMLSSFLNDLDGDARKSKGSKAENASPSRKPPIPRYAAPKKGISPYVAHLASNPKKLRDILTDDKPVQSNHQPFSNKKRLDEAASVAQRKQTAQSKAIDKSNSKGNRKDPSYPSKSIPNKSRDEDSSSHAAETAPKVNKSSSVDDLFSSFLDGLDSDDEDEKPKKPKKKAPSAVITKSSSVLNTKKDDKKPIKATESLQSKDYKVNDKYDDKAKDAAPSSSSSISPIGKRSKAVDESHYGDDSDDDIPTYGQISTTENVHKELIDEDRKDEGDSKPISIESVEGKLDLLEKQLIAERQEMEDNPGFVTEEEERKLAEMEKEAISMRMELQLTRNPSNIKEVVAANRMSSLVKQDEEDEYGDESFDDDDHDHSPKTNQEESIVIPSVNTPTTVSLQSTNASDISMSNQANSNAADDVRRSNQSRPSSSGSAKNSPSKLRSESSSNTKGQAKGVEGSSSSPYNKDKPAYSALSKDESSPDLSSASLSPKANSSKIISVGKSAVIIEDEIKKPSPKSHVELEYDSSAYTGRRRRRDYSDADDNQQEEEEKVLIPKSVIAKTEPSPMKVMTPPTVKQPATDDDGGYDDEDFETYEDDFQE